MTASLEDKIRRLSPCCQNVARLTLDGKTLKETAWELGMTVGTVKQYLTRSVFPALEVTSRNEMLIKRIRELEAQLANSIAWCE